MSNLQTELDKLAAAVAMNLRERIEKGDATPALLDVARKFLEDHKERRDPDGLANVPRQAALDLPFTDEDDE